MKVNYKRSLFSDCLSITLHAVVLATISSTLIGFAAAKPHDTIVATVPVGFGCSGIAISPTGESVYVASVTSTISVISTVSNTVTSTISTGASLVYLAIDPTGQHLFSSQFGPGPNTGESTIYDINLTTDNVSNTTVSQNAQIPALNPSSTLLYLPTWYPNLEGTVQVFNPVGLQLTRVINVEGLPDQIVFTADGTHAYVSNEGSSSFGSGYVSYVNLDTATVKSKIESSSFNHPMYLALSPNGSRLYIVQEDSFNAKGAQKRGILFLDTNTRTVTDEIALSNQGADTANSLTYFGEPALTVDGKFLYVPIYASVSSTGVTAGNTVVVVNTATGKIVDTITVGQAPNQIAIRDANNAYVSNYNDGTVSIIDISE